MPEKETLDTYSLPMKFNIGDEVVLKGRPPEGAPRMIVTTRYAEECPGGIQRHYRGTLLADVPGGFTEHPADRLEEELSLYVPPSPVPPAEKPTRHHDRPRLGASSKRLLHLRLDEMAGELLNLRAELDEVDVIDDGVEAPPTDIEMCP